MNIKDELFGLIHALDDAGIPYALCGGLAMAVHGWPRSTMDIDLMVMPAQLDQVRNIARDLGFNHEPGSMSLSQGTITLVRLVKFSEQDVLPLDLILAGPGMEEVWASRETWPTQDGPVSVISRQGLITMKRRRGSGVDRDDIDKLEAPDAER